MSFLRPASAQLSICSSSPHSRRRTNRRSAASAVAHETDGSGHGRFATRLHAGHHPQVGRACRPTLLEPRLSCGNQGPHTATDKAASVGKACHIHAAAPGGPRYDPSQGEDERRSIDNGIWLCSNCGTLIDNDAARFPPNLLRSWKGRAETRCACQAREAICLRAARERRAAHVRRRGRAGARARAGAEHRGVQRSLVEILGTRTNGALLEGLLEKVVPLIADDSVLLGHVKTLRSWIITSDSIAASFITTERPNEWQLRDFGSARARPPGIW